MSAALDREVNPVDLGEAAPQDGRQLRTGPAPRAVEPGQAPGAIEPGRVPRGVEPGQRVVVRVPATSANLGPGFDSLGLAVSLYDTLAIETLHNEPVGAVIDGAATDTASGKAAGKAAGDAVDTVPGPRLVFELSGEGAQDLPRDDSHLVVRAVDAALARLGYVRGGLKITAENVLPHGRGLGSSASAIVAAISAANALVAKPDRQDTQWILQLASELEGHPDNVAPAIFGSVAISWEQDGRFRSAKVTPAQAVVPVVAVPDVELATEKARAMLPAAIAHQDAAANSGRTALLIHALTQDPSLLLEGTQDFLHQGYRADAMPASAELMEALRARGFAAFISGAGPTVMTLANGRAQARRAADFIAQWHPGGISAGDWRVLLLEVDTEGAKVEMHRR